MYDLLCSGRNLGASEWLGKTTTLSQTPGLAAAGLKGAVRYFDGLTNDARLVLDTLRSAVKHGAIIQNHCRFEQSERDGQEWRCKVRMAGDGSERELRTRCIVNAGGPWGDRLPHSKVQLRMTKGVHLVVDRQRLPVPSAVVLSEGKRILFAIPWGKRVILGTTDTDYKDRIEDVVCDEADLSYILDVVNVVFPEAKLKPQDIISTWAGLRPLVANWRGKPSDISRAHVIRPTEPGWWDIAGGKLTTYRLMGEQMVDRVVTYLGRQTPRCRTADEPILAPSETEGVSGIVPPELNQKVVEHYCRNEWALHLQDVMIRRTSWHHYFAEAPDMALKAADWMAAELGWTAEQREKEIAEYQALCQADRKCTLAKK
jgi:glycerol-3-phosphate dehydrogenase